MFTDERIPVYLANSIILCVFFLTAGCRRCQCHFRGPAEDQQVCQEHKSNDRVKKRNWVKEGEQPENKHNAFVYSRHIFARFCPLSYTCRPSDIFRPLWSKSAKAYIFISFHVYCGSPDTLCHVWPAPVKCNMLQECWSKFMYVYLEFENKILQELIYRQYLKSCVTLAVSFLWKFNWISNCMTS